MNGELGLFVLNAVLMPGAMLRLHVFEDRYKALMAECLEHHKPFGVVFDRLGREVGDELHPVAIGTSAHIRQVSRLSAGRLYVIAGGVERFRIRRVIATQPFWLAQVSPLPEAPDTPGARDLLATATARFRDYVEALLARPLDDPDGLVLPDEPSAASFVIADALQVTPRVKQALLEAEGAAHRLAAEVRLLESEIERLRRRPEPASRRSPRPPGVRFSLN
jgi:Lon protease-like protein